LAHTHGIAKYARTYVRRYTHTHSPKKKVERVKKRGKGDKKKEGGDREERKEKKEKDKKKTSKEKENRGKREEKMKAKEGVSGAWVLRRAGPHTNNARST